MLKPILTLIENRKALMHAIRMQLFFLENNDLSIWGSITQEDELGIRKAEESSRQFEGPIVEIGALFGHTTNFLATLKPEHKRMIAVENFTWNPFSLPPDAHRLFTRRTLRYVMEKCNTAIYDGDAEAFYDANPDLKPSLVFIDALHSYEGVKKDIDWALSSGAAVIAGHDYSRLHPGVVRAVDEAFGGNIEVVGSVWIAREAAPAIS
jgi:hypothetical protein